MGIVGFVSWIILCWFTVILVVESHPPVEVPKPKLRPVKTWVGKQCNFRMYKKIFLELHNNPELSLIKLLLEGTFIDPNSEDGEPKSYASYLEDLCISIGEDQIVDPVAFDCSPNKISLKPGEFCICGKEMNAVDPNVNSRPQISTYEEITQYKTVGLNRKLVWEDDKCVSGHMGHCNETLPIPLKCMRGTKCQLFKEENRGRELVNQKSRTVYGICRGPAKVKRGGGIGRSAENQNTTKSEATHLPGSPSQTLLLMSVSFAVLYKIRN